MFKKTITDAKRYLVTSALITMLDAVRNIVVVNLMGPYYTGLCTTLMIIPQISQYFNLGLIDTLPVLVPRNTAENNIERTNNIKISIFNITATMSFMSFIFVLFYALAISNKNTVVNCYFVLAGLLTILWQMKKFFMTAYVAEDNFYKFNRIELFFSFLVALTQILAVHFYGQYGFWFGFIIPNIIIIAYVARDYLKNNHLRLFSYDFKEVIKIVPLGISMMAYGVTYAPFMIVAKLFLASTVGVHEVGLFILAMILIPRISMFSNMIARVILPKISYLRAGGENFKDIFNLYVKAQVLTFGLTIILTILGLFFIGPAVTHVMPKYTTGLPAAKMILFAIIPYSLIDCANTILLTMHHKRALLINLTKAIGVQSALFLTLYLTDHTSAYTVAASLIVVFSYLAIITNYKVLQIYLERFSRISIVESKEDPFKTAHDSTIVEMHIMP